MSKERIRKIAKRQGVTVEEVVSALARLGFGKYRLANDMLPAPVVDKVEPLLRAGAGGRRIAPHAGAAGSTPQTLAESPMPSEIPEDPALNSVLQDYLSARPLQELRRSLPDISTKESKPKPSGSPEGVLRESLGAEIRRRRLANEQAERIGAEFSRYRSLAEEKERELRAKVAQIQVESREAELAAAEKSNAAQLACTKLTVDLDASRLEVVNLKEELLRERSRLHRTEEDCQQLQEQVRLLKEAMAEKKGESNEEEAVETKPGLELVRRPVEVTPIEIILAERGLKTPAEIRAAFQSMLRDFTFRETLSLLGTASPYKLRDFLNQRLGLLCDDCQPSQGVAAVRVSPSSRCENCEGNAEALAAAEFVEVCRSRQVRRVMLVGGAPHAVDKLKELTAELELHVFDPRSKGTLEAARREVDASDVTISWEGAMIDQRTSSLFRRLDDPRVIRVGHRGLGGMLRLASEKLRHRKGRLMRGGAALFQ